MQINGAEYFSASDLAQELGISRQTLWRWRQDGKIPQGHRFRDKQIVFTADEAKAVRDFATKLEPANSTQPDQFKLFNSADRRIR
jgi:transcriptional regulator with XRE-family HTH domain